MRYRPFLRRVAAPRRPRRRRSPPLRPGRASRGDHHPRFALDEFVDVATDAVRGLTLLASPARSANTNDLSSACRCPCPYTMSFIALIDGVRSSSLGSTPCGKQTTGRRRSDRDGRAGTRRAPRSGRFPRRDLCVLVDARVAHGNSAPAARAALAARGRRDTADVRVRGETDDEEMVEECGSVGTRASVEEASSRVRRARRASPRRPRRPSRSASVGRGPTALARAARGEPLAFLHRERLGVEPSAVVGVGGGVARGRGRVGGGGAGAGPAARAEHARHARVQAPREGLGGGGGGAARGTRTRDADARARAATSGASPARIRQGRRGSP